MAFRNQPGRNVLHGPQCSRIFAGLLDVEHRLAIATRHGKVVLMKNGAVTSTIHLDVSTVCTVAPAFLVMHSTASSCGVCYCPASCHMAAVQLLFSGFAYATLPEAHTHSWLSLSAYTAYTVPDAIPCRTHYTPGYLRGQLCSAALSDRRMVLTRRRSLWSEDQLQQ